MASIIASTCACPKCRDTKHKCWRTYHDVSMIAYVCILLLKSRNSWASQLRQQSLIILQTGRSPWKWTCIPQCCSLITIQYTRQLNLFEQQRRRWANVRWKLAQRPYIMSAWVDARTGALRITGPALYPLGYRAPCSFRWCYLLCKQRLAVNDFLQQEVNCFYTALFSPMLLITTTVCSSI